MELGVNQKVTNNQQWVSRVTGSSSGNRFFLWVIMHLGLYPSYFFLLFASVQYALFDKKSKQAIREFRSRLGLKTSFIDFLQHFRSFGESIIDRIYLQLSGVNPFRIEHDDSELLCCEVNKGKGAILIGAHFGNWALAGSLLKERINVAVNLVMYSSEKDSLKLRSKEEGGGDFNIISINPEKPENMIEILNALRKGELVCFLGDRILSDQRYEMMNFLGKEACFPSGPFVLASVADVPVIPFFAIKRNIKTYRIKAFKPISVRSKDSTEIRDAISKYVAYFEEMVKENPYQWYNFYPFWRE
jgi:predicted LPLAT superfamily acyltransferase